MRAADSLNGGFRSEGSHLFDAVRTDEPILNRLNEEGRYLHFAKRRTRVTGQGQPKTVGEHSRLHRSYSRPYGSHQRGGRFASNEQTLDRNCWRFYEKAGG